MFGEIHSKCIKFSYKFYLQTYVNKNTFWSIFYQFHLCIGSFNLAMPTFPLYTGLFNLDYAYLCCMLSGRTEQFVIFILTSHIHVAI